MNTGFKNIRWLALADYRHEWQMSLCFVLALASVLAPLMVLFGLKFGIVSQMIDTLVQDPQNREIRPVGSGHYPPDWFQQLRQRPDVAFIIPRTRLIASSADISAEQANGQQKIRSAELIPSGPQDPLLQPLPEELRQQLNGSHHAIASHALADKLQLKPGQQIQLSLSRQYQGRRERVQHPLTLIAIAPPAAFARDGLFLPLPLLDAAEAYRDGRAVPALGWDGQTQASTGPKDYPLFRLYADNIDQVAQLQTHLQSQGIEVRAKTADIQLVQRTDRNLSLIFWIIALVGLLGFGLSLGASLWANVERKTRDLAVIRLVGFRSLDIVWFPLLQSLLTAILGWALASILYLGIENAINLIFTDRQICRLLPQHYLAAAALTLSCAALAAILGGYRATKIQASDGLRET